MVILNPELCISKWKPIIDNINIKNQKLVKYYSIYLEWLYCSSNEFRQDGIYKDISDEVKELNKRITQFSSYKKIEMYLNELTGNIEYYIGGKFYKESEIPLSEEAIKSVFCDEYYNFLNKQDLI